MAELIEENREKRIIPKLILRIIRASLWGFVMGGEILLLIILTDSVLPYMNLFQFNESSFSYFLVVFIAFEVVSQLLSGTVYPYILNAARIIITMIYSVITTNNGIMTINLQSLPEIPVPSSMNVILTINLQTVLGVFLLLSVLSFTKNFFQAINYLSTKAEEPMIPMELP